MKLTHEKINVLNTGKIFFFFIFSIFSVSFFSASSNKLDQISQSIEHYPQLEAVEGDEFDVDMILSVRHTKVSKKISFLDHFFTKTEEIRVTKIQLSYYYLVEKIQSGVHSFLHLLTLF